MKKSSSLFEALVAAGYKATEPRRQIVNWIENNHQPFSVANLVEALSHLNRVSVYRTVDILTKLDLIHPTLQLHGHQLYEVHEKKKHHHHIICTDCEKSACLPCVIVDKPVRGFQFLHHEVHFTSLCTTCAN